MSRLFRNMIAKEEFNPEAQQQEVNSEAGELAIVENEVNEDVGEVDADAEDIETIGDGIEDTSADVEHLENIETTLEEALDNPDHPGMDEIAVESLNAVISMISVNRGFTSTLNSTSNLVARENFDSSVTVRRTNTRAVLLSVKDSLKNIWEQIKAALKTLWSKITAFWGKHISTLGRMKKSAEAMKLAINGNKGTPDATKEIKTPGAFKRAFPGVSEIDAKLFPEYAKRHAKAVEEVNLFSELSVTMAEEILKAKGSDVDLVGPFKRDSHGDIEVGTKNEPLLGGFYGTIKTEVTPAEGDKKEKIKVTFSKEQSEANKVEDVEFVVGTRQELLATVSSIIGIIDSTKDLNKKFSGFEKSYRGAMEAIDKSVASNDIGDERNNKMTAQGRELTKVFRTLGTVTPNVNAKIASLNTNLAALGLKYVSMSLRTYKKLAK